MATNDTSATRPGPFGSATPFAALAKARVALAVLNFPLAYVSDVSPYEANWPLARGMAVCAAFLAWTVASSTLLIRPRGSWLANLLPTLDVLAAVGLVAGTGGAGGPFIPWVSLMAIGTVAVNRRGYAALAGLVAAGAILRFGTPQANHGPITTLVVVRALWVVVFTGFGYLVGALWEDQLRHLGTLETFTAEAGAATDTAQVLEAFRRAVDAVARPDSVVVRLEVFETPTRPRLSPGPGWIRVPIVSGSHDLGEAHVGRRRRFAPPERLALNLLGERLASALLRLRLSAELVEEAARQERLALADELHDTTIQTLTALDLGATLLQRLVADDSEAWELAGELGDQARGHIAHVRRFIRDSVTERVPGPEALAALFEERWHGRYELRLDPAARLSEARWRLLGLMAREGLNNARKHGRATHVCLDMTARGDGFEARLTADGTTPVADARPGYGLTRLRAVAAAQNASVELLPGPDGGSVLAVRAGEATR